jgi:predicted PurR-regulated permease PerM
MHRMQRPITRLPQLTMGVAFIALLGGASLWVLSPFLLALIWAAMIVIATWPALGALQRRLGGSRGAAAALMTLLLLLVFILPLVITIAMVITHAQDIVSWGNSVQSLQLPTAPQWVADLPAVGDKLALAWNELVGGGLARLKPYAMQAISWLAGQLGTVGAALVHVMFTLVIAAILYAQGDVAATGVRRFLHRLAGESGDKAAVLAAQAVRGVALGVVVTAVAQTTVSGVGLAIAGVPFAGPLTLLVLLLCIAQVGPFLVLVPSVIWLYYSGDNAWATVLLVFTLVAGTMDNVLRPYLIKKGADLPLLLIFAGVIGGLLSIGVVGIFVGPVVLAVTYRLLEEWVRKEDEEAALPAEALGDDGPRQQA